MKPARSGTTGLRIATSSAVEASAVLPDDVFDDAMEDTTSDVDSLFDDPADVHDVSNASIRPIPTTRLAPSKSVRGLGRVAQRTAPPIPGLYFDPSVDIPCSIADQLLQQCKTLWFRDESTNQIMLFGRAHDPSPTFSSASPQSTTSGLPPFLTSLLSDLADLLRPTLPPDIHRLLFPPPSEPSRARQAIINLYRPGEGITPHVDLPRRFGDGIIGVSLGSGCVMNFRRATAQEEQGGYGLVGGVNTDTDDEDNVDNDGKRSRWDIYLPSRSVLVMTGDARKRWTHGIEGTAEDLVGCESEGSSDNGVAEVIPRSERLSITFRWLLPGAEVVGGSEMV